MQPSQSITVSQFLERFAQELDIPDSFHEDAVVQYEDVGDWLTAEDSSLAQYTPAVYAQGSFRLGTVVRPISNEDHYDIDLVCRLNLRKEAVTQDGRAQMPKRLCACSRQSLSRAAFGSTLILVGVLHLSSDMPS
jgi:hypothetical protein